MTHGRSGNALAPTPRRKSAPTLSFLALKRFIPPAPRARPARCRSDARPVASTRPTDAIPHSRLGGAFSRLTGSRPAGLCPSVVLVLLMLVGPARGLYAQADQDVLDLNRQAMDAYNNLELDQAKQLLEQALQAAERGRVSASTLARTHANLGVVYVGGFADNGRGLEHFSSALRADPEVQLDPLTSTPDIETVFQLARGQMGPSASPPARAPAPAPRSEPVQGAGGLAHEPVPEQLTQTPVPVYLEAPGEVERVYLFYQGRGMSSFRRVRMGRIGRGYGYEIPCGDVFEPSVRYYIVAFGEDGSPVGFVGTQNDPLEVAIVSRRNMPAPALPGRRPPEQCRDEECPPGMSGCDKLGRNAEEEDEYDRMEGVGAFCSSDEDCGEGLACVEDLCELSEGGGGDSDAPRFFLQVGGVVGLGLATGGMPADTFPQNAPASAADLENLAWVPANGSPQAFDQRTDCNLPQNPDGTYNYCVRVAQPGIVPTYGVRVAIGYYFADWFGAALFARIQPTAGSGALSFMLIGARIQAELTHPTSEGLFVALHLGGSAGQVQLQPPGNDPPPPDTPPWIISGLGGASAGTTFGYRFMKHFGLYAEVDLMLQFPTFLFNTDVSLGLETGF